MTEKHPETVRATPRPSDLSIVKDLAISLLRRSTLHELLWDLASAIGSLPGFEDSIVYFLEGDELVQLAAYGLKAGRGRTVIEPLRIPMGEGIVGSVAESQVAELISDTRLDPRYIRDTFDGRSELTVPVLFEGKVLAVLDTESQQVAAYSTEDMEILQTMANIAAPRIASAIRESETATARQELAELNRELEQRIESRTRVLNQTTELLRSERDRLSAILNTMDDGIIAVDRSLIVQLASRSAVDQLGLELASIVGSPLHTIFRLQGIEDVRSAVNHGQPPLEAILETDKGTREVRWTVNEVPGSDSPVGYVVIFRDITHENFLTQQAIRVQRMESLGVLAGGIAHNFNNYLAAIASSVDTARLSEDRETQRIMLQTAADACDESRHLTQQLLTYSAGGDPVLQPSSVRTIVDSAVRLATSGKRVQTRISVSEELPAVIADPGQMTQAISNILINATQAMPVGCEILIKAATRPGSLKFVELTISDNGPGIANDVVDRLFEPYFTTHDAGTGLGLTTSYFIMRNHGGTIVAGNSKPGGAEFTLSIPVSDKPAIVTATPVNDEDGTARALTVLVVDDESMVRRSLHRLLHAIGHCPLEAANVSEAVQVTQAALASGGQLDAAIVDLTLGTETGLDALQRLKELSPDTWFIVSSGYFDSAVMANFESHGFCGKLAKPFGYEDLKRELAKAARRSN